MKTERLKTDILIIGGGTAGCYAALTLAENSDAKVLICEKANIKRSGCLAAGVNALNAYITEGRTPKDYVDYARKDADGIVRDDLLYTMSERLNKVTARLEQLGLVILKDKDGKYVARGNRNIKINGENMKVYIDLIVIINYMYDLMILTSVSILLKRHPKTYRLLLGSLLGSITIITLFIRLSPFMLLLLKILTSVCVVLISFGTKGFKENIF